jgi:hypothetical protein
MTTGAARSRWREVAALVEDARETWAPAAGLPAYQPRSWRVGIQRACAHD